MQRFLSQANGITPLYAASIRNCFALVKLLAERGAYKCLYWWNKHNFSTRVWAYLAHGGFNLDQVSLLQQIEQRWKGILQRDVPALHMLFSALWENITQDDLRGGQYTLDSDVHRINYWNSFRSLTLREMCDSDEYTPSDE